MKCDCDSLELFRYGCLCGAFANEKIKHLWFNGKIYVIAKTEDQAVFLAEKELSSQSDFSPMWIVGDGSGWRQIKEDEPITLSFSDLSTDTKLAAEWLEFYSEGFLSSA